MVVSPTVGYLLGVVTLLLVIWKNLLPFLNERRRKDKLLKNMPAPPSFPLLGNITQLMKVDGNPYELLDELSQELGPVFKLRLGPSQWMVAVNGYEAIHDVLVKCGNAFSGRSGNYRSEVFSGKAGLIAMDYSIAKVKLLRKLSTAAIKPIGSGKSRMEKLAMEMTDEFLDVFYQSNGHAIDPFMDIQSAAIRMLSLITFGEKYDVGSRQFETISEVTSLMNWCVAEQGSGMLLDVFPWLRFFGNTVYKKLKYATDLSKSFSYEAIEKMEKKMRDKVMDTDENMKPLLEAMLEYNRDNEQTFDANDIRVLAFQLQMAGVLTTTSTLYALLNILLHHKDIQKNIHHEIDSVLGNKLVELEDQNRLPYTWATILELLRYTSISPLTIPHKALEDAQILDGRFTIPKGTLVMPNLWTVHHDKTLWGDPQRFKPERFLDSSGNLLPHEHANRRHLLAFGAGPRSCVGEAFALARLFLWTVVILQRFSLHPPADDGQLVPCEPKSYNSGLVLTPQRFKVRFIEKHT